MRGEGVGPSNTDPETEPGFLDAFIREFAHSGEWGQEIGQEGCTERRCEPGPERSGPRSAGPGLAQSVLLAAG